MRTHASLTFLLAGLVLGACGTPRAPLPAPGLEITVVEDYAKVRPVRVVVPPVEASAALGVPLDAVRESFYRMLIQRNYAPFRLDIDAAAIPEDTSRGTLAILITKWDRSRLMDRRRIIVSGEATMLRGGRVLWKVAFSSLALRATKRDVVQTVRQKDRLAAAALGSHVLRDLPPKSD